MANNIVDLCRLCAKKEQSLKDLFHKSNENALQLIQEYVKIVISNSEGLPTKICLNCEEKMVSFQLFILECHKAQDYLKLLTLESKVFCPDIKVEKDSALCSISEVKSEVKNELTAEDIVSAITNEGSFSDFGNVEYDEINDYDDENNDHDSSDSDDTNSKDKKIHQKRPKRKHMTPEDADKLNEILKKSYLKVKDFIKIVCHICGEQLKNWNILTVHCFKNHKRKPLVYCICGFPITSHSVLYKHVTYHKSESRKSRIIDSEDNSKSESKCDALNVKDFVVFSCNNCKKQCSSWYSLKSHSEKAHSELPVVTCKCGITLKSKSVLYKHIQDHKNPNVFICDKCPRITKSLAALNKHKMRHVPKADRKFNCFSCEKIFTTRDALKSHERSHIPIEDRKVYHCEICNLKFTTRSSAASHKRVVHDRIKSYVCDLCGYACGTNGELRQHRAIHSDEKPFVCSKCSKPFKTYSNLKTHMDTHEDTSYACYVCNRVLNSRRTLRKHLLVHEDKCRHVCSYCNKAFKRRQTLKVHMYTHTGDKPLSCKWCDERFSYASTLRSHRLRCHPDKLAQANNSYIPYENNVSEYLKNGGVDVEKNEVEAM